MIDDSKLPMSALFDTTVILPALDAKVASTNRALCAAIVEGMLAQRRRVMIAAPTKAEMCVGGLLLDDLPNTADIRVVPFDSEAASLFYHQFPKEKLKKLRNATTPPLNKNAVKFDAQIVACALRWKVAMLVTDDTGQMAIARAAGLLAVKPEHFLSAQLPLV